MIVELFILGGVAFWILSGVIFLLLLWAASDDRAVASGLLLGAYLIAIYLFGNASSLHPPGWIFYIGLPAYFMIGTLWGVAKWYLFVSREMMPYRFQRQEFLVDHGIKHATLDTPVPEELRETWSQLRHYVSRPVAQIHKRRIIAWMCFWPTSILWAVIDEPWRRIYNALATLLQSIADRAYERTGVDVDMAPPKKTKKGGGGGV